MPAKPLRTALGTLLIQKQLGFSDRELVEEITENPYLQYFIGLPGYQAVPPFVPSLLEDNFSTGYQYAERGRGKS